MARAWIIAKNTVLEIRQRRLSYLVAALVILTMLSVWSSVSMMERARNAGETTFAARIPQTMITSTIQLWDNAIRLIVLFLGATVISAEVKTRAIIPTLARPVSRREFLVGKTLGVVLTSVLLFVLPFSLTVFTAWWFGVDLTLTFWLGLAQTLTEYVSVATMTVALAAVTSPVAAGLTVLVVMPLLQWGGAELASAADPVYAALGFLAYCLAPADAPHDLLHQFNSSVLDPAHGLTTLVMLENLGYAAVLFTLAGWAFDVREIHADA